MRNLTVLAALVGLACVDLGPLRNGPVQADEAEPVWQATLSFQVVRADGPPEEGAAPLQPSEVVLVMPAPKGHTASLRESFKRDVSSGTWQPPGGGDGQGQAVWLDDDVPTTGVAAGARIRPDGLLAVAWSVSLADDAGTVTLQQGVDEEGEPVVHEDRVVSGPSATGEVLFGPTGGTSTITRLKDRNGRLFEVELTATVSQVR